MQIVFFSNYFNHHQKPLADAFNKLAGVEYVFVVTEGIPEFRKKLGYVPMTAEYVLDTTISEDNRNKAYMLAQKADVAIFMGGFMEYYEKPRLKQKKLTFEYSERRFKKGLINILSPNLLKHQWMYYRYGRKAPVYMLCSSAYTANDFYGMNSFVDRCYKWAYFTKIETISIDSILASKRQNKCRIMWCGRFIGWKHPEMAIQLAEKLKGEGLDFEINMYGNGPLVKKIEQCIYSSDLSDCVKIKGNTNNEGIISAMRQHNIFLFTSDRNEGWGAVTNEAMSNCCTIVGSNEIGSIPFLVENHKNGVIFKSKDVASLYSKVKELILDRKKCEELSREAYLSLLQIWSPENAANKFVKLVSEINNGNVFPFQTGPCSKAIPINKNSLYD